MTKAGRSALTNPEPQSVPTLNASGRPDATTRMIWAGCAACWTAFLLIMCAVQAGHGGQFDEAALLLGRGDAPYFAPRGSPLLLETIRDLTALGGVLLRNLIALVAVVALMFLHRRRAALVVGFTVGIGWLVNSMLKELIGRERPPIIIHLTEAGGASFPSGHSFNSAAVFIAIALAFASLNARQAVQATIWTVAIALSLAVAWSRVWLGVHFPTDVLAGWLGGAGWALLVAAMFRTRWP